ncbi:molybdopterin containing oxidoreductase [Helicobacter sp. 13S00401-1]|uniref:sulfite oxidase n=1 Tax=Helicobacter sp. 13S00401-1 TaxID=1905758 RepID=UPI000BA6785E|nr:sulfite oxidase [Helicobacter sp. 13S00401-1]PAF51092.1 molybdopterin containing oxidoreductase [Helicobacter sp. 13S00401-1]
MKKKTKGIHEAYAKDPIKADLDIFGREVDPLTRRGFLKKSSLIAMASVVGASIPFADKMPGGLMPALLANELHPFSVKGKDGLVYLNDKPINAETLPQFLDDPFTKPEHFFIRNNGIPPAMKDIDLSKWELRIEGESCERPTTFKLDELKKRFKHYTYALTLECGGNNRFDVVPATRGNQWHVGAVGCGRWTGVRLKDVLESCGIKKDAVYIGYYGADTSLSGNGEVPISRGVPMHKALEDETLIAWQYEGQDIPYMNGYPLRLAIGGWPASVAGKWLVRVVVRNKVHDGPKMGGGSYRIPCTPVAPGEKVDPNDMCILESMAVKSLITFPLSGVHAPLDKALALRGKAWAGDLSVSQMHVSIDYGATWHKAKLKKPINHLAWQEWEASVKFPTKGYYEVWARATDSKGKSQPMVLGAWNPGGYNNNSCHRIAVRVV